MQVSEDVRRQMYEEHRNLRLLEETLLDRCAEYCARPDDAHLDRVRQVFGDFDTSLRKHFEFEEGGGYLRTVTDRRPHHAQAVDRLLAEHNELTRMLNTNREYLQGAVHEDHECLQQFKSDIATLMARFDRHEAAERELMMEVFWLEGGGSE